MSKPTDKNQKSGVLPFLEKVFTKVGEYEKANAERNMTGFTDEEKGLKGSEKET